MVARLMSTRYPLCCVVMELAAQLEARITWLNLRWRPREENALDDALTNSDFGQFELRNRICLSFSDLPFLLLTCFIAIGAPLFSSIKALKRCRDVELKAPVWQDRRSSRQRIRSARFSLLKDSKCKFVKTRHQRTRRMGRLRVTDPW